jgi:hypothetical protein
LFLLCYCFTTHLTRSFFASFIFVNPPVILPAAIMVYLSQAFKAAVTVALLGHSVIAHANHDINQEIAERNAFYKNSKRDLTHCNDLLRKRGMENKQAKRRQAALEAARAKRGLPQSEFVPADSPNTKTKIAPERQGWKRDLASVTNTSHLSTLDVTPTTSGVEEIIFSNSSCLLSPEGEIGPFCE